MSLLGRWAAVAAAMLVVGPFAFGQVNIGANFQTLKFSDGAGGTPPDTNGSIGPNFFTQYNNGLVGFYNKSGVRIGNILGEKAFWLSTGLPSAIANTAFGDPRIQFDPLSGRWFATAFTNQNTNNSILIARSDTPDPTGTWKAVSFATTINRFADYPTLSIDRNGVYIGTNNFNGSFSVTVLSFPKADLLLSTPSTTNMTAFQGQSANTRGFTPQGITNFNLGQTSSTGTAIFAISNTAFAQAKYTPLTGTAGAGATLGSTATLNLANYTNNPPPGIQPDAGNSAVSTTTLDALDDRYGSRVYRVGNLMYGVHWIASPTTSRAALQVTVLDMSTTTPTVFAETTLTEPNFDYLVGSIAANARGDVVVGFTRTGFVSSGDASNRWPSSYVAVGTLTGSTLSFGTPIELRTGAFYALQQSAVNRWGDYSATNVDPADTGIFWTTQEFGRASNDYATQATEIIPTVTGEKRWASISSSTPAGITGSFATAANWYNGVAPSGSDHVIFSRNGNGSTAYTVSFVGTTSVDRASVRQGNVIWNLPTGAAFNLTNLGTGDSDVAGNVTSAASLAIADYLGTAKLTVSGGGTLNSVTTTIGAGLNSEGAANVSNGSLTISGSGTTWMNSGNAYVGGNATRGGGSGSLTVDGGATANVAGNLIGYNRSTGLSANTITVGSGSTLTVSGLSNPGTGTVPSTVSLSNSSSQIIISGGSGTTFGGTISGSGSLTKVNAGSFTLTGANTYAGATSITGGTLKLAGSGSFAASPAITIGAGATLDITTGGANLTGGANFDATTGQFALTSGQTLQGTGTANAGVTALPGSGLRGGTGTGLGTLTVGGNAILLGAPGSSGATLTTILAGNGTTSPASSLLATNNLDLLSDSTNKLNISVAVSSNTNQIVQFQLNTVVLATATGTIQVNGVTQPGLAPIDPTTYNLTSNMLLDPDYQLSLDATGQALVFSFTPVPEPGTIIGIAAVGLGLVGAARRRRI